MRLGLAVLGAGAVFSGHFLLNAVDSLPAEAPSARSASGRNRRDASRSSSAG